MDSGPIGLMGLLTLGAALFAVGLAGFLLRRNLLVMFLAGELMLQGVIVTLSVGFGRLHGSLAGQAFAIFVLVLAAVEAAFGLGLVVLMFRRQGTLDAESWRSLKE